MCTGALRANSEDRMNVQLEYFKLAFDHEKEHVSYFMPQIDPNRPDHRGIIPLTLAAAYGHYDCFKILLDHTKSQPVLAQHPTLLHVAVEAALSSEVNADNSYCIMKLLFEQRREFFDQMMSSNTHPTVVELAIWYGRVMVST